MSLYIPNIDVTNRQRIRTASHLHGVELRYIEGALYIVKVNDDGEIESGAEVILDTPPVRATANATTSTSIDTTLDDIMTLEEYNRTNDFWITLHTLQNAYESDYTSDDIKYIEVYNHSKYNGIYRINEDDLINNGLFINYSPTPWILADYEAYANWESTTTVNTRPLSDLPTGVSDEQFTNYVKVNNGIIEYSDIPRYTTFSGVFVWYDADEAYLSIFFRNSNQTVTLNYLPLRIGDRLQLSIDENDIRQTQTQGFDYITREIEIPTEFIGTFDGGVFIDMVSFGEPQDGVLTPVVDEFYYLNVGVINDDKFIDYSDYSVHVDCTVCINGARFSPEKTYNVSDFVFLYIKNKQRKTGNWRSHSEYLRDYKGWYEISENREYILDQGLSLASFTSDLVTAPLVPGLGPASGIRKLFDETKFDSVSNAIMMYEFQPPYNQIANEQTHDDAPANVEPDWENFAFSSPPTYHYWSLQFYSWLHTQSLYDSNDYDYDTLSTKYAETFFNLPKPTEKKYQFDAPPQPNFTVDTNKLGHYVYSKIMYNDPDNIYLYFLVRSIEEADYDLNINTDWMLPLIPEDWIYDHFGFTNLTGTDTKIVTLGYPFKIDIPIQKSMIQPTQKWRDYLGIVRDCRRIKITLPNTYPVLMAPKEEQIRNIEHLNPYYSDCTLLANIRQVEGSYSDKRIIVSEINPKYNLRITDFVDHDIVEITNASPHVDLNGLYLFEQSEQEDGSTIHLKNRPLTDTVGNDISSDITMPMGAYIGGNLSGGTANIRRIACNAKISAFADMLTYIKIEFFDSSYANEFRMHDEIAWICHSLRDSDNNPIGGEKTWHISRQKSQDGEIILPQQNSTQNCIYIKDEDFRGVLLHPNNNTTSPLNIIVRRKMCQSRG